MNMKQLFTAIVLTISVSIGLITGASAEEGFVESNSDCEISSTMPCVTATITVKVDKYVKMLKNAGIKTVSLSRLYEINGWSDSAVMIRAGTHIRIL